MYFRVSSTSWSRCNVLQDDDYRLYFEHFQQNQICLNQSRVFHLLGSEQVEQAMPDEPQTEPQEESGSSSELKTTVIEESSSTIEVSEKNTSKVEESKITIEQKVIVAEQSTERVVTLTEEASTHFSSGK